MQEEWYESTPSSRRRFERTLSTQKGREKVAMRLYEMHKILEWRIKNKGFTLPPDEMKRHEEIMAAKGKPC